MNRMGELIVKSMLDISLQFKYLSRFIVVVLGVQLEIYLNVEVRGRTRDENRILGILNDDQKTKNGNKNSINHKEHLIATLGPVN